MKKCISCKVEKKFIEFHKSKIAKDCLQSKCKTCCKEYRDKYYELNKNYSKEYYINNKNKIQKYQEENSDKIEKWKKKNYQRTKETRKEYRDNNKENRKKWHLKNKGYNEKYYLDNKVKIKKYTVEYAKEKRKTNPLFKLQCNLRSRTSQAFRNNGYTKNTKTQEMLGVDWEVCKAHIERQFTKDMTWDNQGEWHIDHIIPLSSANTEEELKKLCHYSNLQPLWAVDNLIKSAKINGQQTLLRI